MGKPSLEEVFKFLKAEDERLERERAKSPEWHAENLAKLNQRYADWKAKKDKRRNKKNPTL